MIVPTAAHPYTVIMAVDSERQVVSLSDVLELLEERGVTFHGWFADTAEGALAAYSEEPETTLELADDVAEDAVAA